MAEFTKIALLVLLLLFCKKTTGAENDSKEELVQSESKDGNLEIVKQIKKVNDDGSYTIGYEADDGSFKIESRDVLGNIKGTYGYIDDSGQIKRVSYSTSNTSEIISTPEPPSVVQRIPKTNKTHTYTTRRPGTMYSTTQSTPSSTSQRLSKVRNYLSTTPSSTTAKPNYSDVVNVDSEISKSTSRPNVVYATSTPRILLQSRPSSRSTSTLNQKSEGQLVRPEIITPGSTELPLFRRLALKHPLPNEPKPVIEEPEIRSNILRRQLSHEKTSNFDPQQHVFTLQQGLGNDVTDVYSASVTTGTPRPLFTTTARPRALLSTTSIPTLISRPTIRYPPNYQRNDLQDLESNTQEYSQQGATQESSSSASTSTPVPVVQIPANRPEPLVAIRHPYQPGTILVPLSQLQGSRVVPFNNLKNINDNQQQYEDSPEQYVKETTTQPPVPVQARPVYVRRVPIPPPQFRPIPVQVDENGFIREIASNAVPTPYSLPVPITPAPKYEDVDNDIDKISPPVSTRDFQRLLQQLIVRQARLEKISELTNTRRHPELFQPRYRPVYRPAPYYVQRVPPPESQTSGPVQFLPDEMQQRPRQFVQIDPRQQQLRHNQQQDELYSQRQQYSPDEQSYVPTRRVARLLQPGHNARQDISEEFLPPDVREMLLLRMLQLAINPALPIAEGELGEGTTQVPQYKKAPVRNVEILGEEPDEDKTRRSKRYRESVLDYYEHN